MSHTPGPWEFRDDHPERACVHVVWHDPEYAGSDWKPEVCTVFASNDRFMSDARLIAAAPRLLKACEGLLDRYLIMGCGEGPEAMEAKCAIAEATSAARSGS